MWKREEGEKTINWRVSEVPKWRTIANKENRILNRVRRESDEETKTKKRWREKIRKEKGKMRKEMERKKEKERWKERKKKKERKDPDTRTYAGTRSYLDTRYTFQTGTRYLLTHTHKRTHAHTTSRHSQTRRATLDTTINTHTQPSHTYNNTHHITQWEVVMKSIQYCIGCGMNE